MCQCIMKNIYLAGPLFSKAEQEFNRTIFDALADAGYNVFLPQEECTGLTDVRIFEKCREGIDSSEIMIAILDGADADSGTCWECGYAFANHKHIIAVRTDFRNSGDTDGFNAMLYYSADKVITGNDYLAEIKKYLRSI
jgi:nucleoside 2-deoxyribosyltransferase